MTHFSLKSLSFYAIAIGSVVTLFSITTAYGEANLKAPSRIAGRYRLMAQTLPGCLRGQDVRLTIEQSGIYLQGSLLAAADTAHTLTAAKKKPSLTGLWQQQQVTLSGPVSHLNACEGRVPTIALQGKIVNTQFTGTLTLNGRETVQFAADREASPAPTSSH